jgi:hypothetical protein
VVGGVAFLVLAGLMLLCGTSSTIAYIATPLMQRANAAMVQNNLVFGAFAGMGMLMGGALGWLGIRTILGKESRAVAKVFPPFGFFLAAFFLAVGIGAALLAYQNDLLQVVVFTFPIAHFLASVTPALALLAYAARRLGKSSTARAAFVPLTWGALAAPTFAFVVEVIAAIIMAFVAVFVFALVPGNLAQLERLGRELQTIQRTSDYSSATQWLTNPWIIIAVLTYLAGLVPLIEEALKATVVALIDPRRTRLSDATMWGICAGAGYALLESLLNGGATLSGWAPIILLRAGTTTIHVVNGALMGRGWYFARVQGRWSKLFQAYGLCVVLHAIWNGASLAMTGGTFLLTEGTRSAVNSIVPASVFTAAMATVLAILATISLVVIVYTVRQAERADAPTA